MRLAARTRAGTRGFVASAVAARRLLTASLVSGMALIGPVSAADLAPQGPRDGFIKREGTRFVLNGKPFFVAGVNNHYLTYGSEAEVLRVLDDAVLLGANVVRTFLQPVIGSPNGSVPTIWDWKRDAETSNLGVHGNYLLYWNAAKKGMAINWGENGFRKVDVLVAEAAKRHLRLIVAFADFWAFTGGAQQMSAWYGSDDKHRFFFEDSRTKKDYQTWVREVAQHVNPLTGVAYKDDPTIFAWDLMNEPEASPSRVRNQWISEMAAYVKAVDPNHLVTSGQANVSGNLSDIANPQLDFAVWHGYPLYYRLTVAQFDLLIRDFCARAREHDKPVLLEEFGYARSNPDQAAAYQMWLRTIDEDPDCSGWVVWRLVSRQDSNRYPEDEYDQFDIRNDGSRIWEVVHKAASDLRSKMAP